MQELIVISGKGGTGKTSLMAAFASLAENKVLCDADVDAADLHLVMAPDIRQREPFTSGHTAAIDKNRCTECGVCRDLCRWDAIDEKFAVDAVACEGCGVCVHFCPEKAIDFPENTCGEWFVSETRFGPLVHARLGIAEENSGKLVALVRQEARKLAEARGVNLILTDGPPGVGCPVIASMGGASGVLIVAEPSVSGVHDMERVVQLATHFNVPAMVCVNKFDINTEKSRQIEEFTSRRGLAFLGRVPFDPAFTRAMVQERTIFEYDGPSDARAAVVGVWNNLFGYLGMAA
jgi:MinD superfamily P-loop ATPase